MRFYIWLVKLDDAWFGSIGLCFCLTFLVWVFGYCWFVGLDLLCTGAYGGFVCYGVCT